MDALELSHGNSFQRLIPIFGVDKDGTKSPLPTEDMEVTFSIHKNGKLEYTVNLEKKDGGFLLDLSDEDINMFEPGEYNAKIKVKQGKETQTKSIPIIISND